MEDECTTNPDTQNTQGSVFNCAQESVSKPKLRILQCTKHAKMELTIFCQDCNELVCPVCLTRDHQKHMMYDIYTIHREKLKILEENLCIIDNDFMPFFSEENSKLDKILKSHQDHFKNMKDKIEKQKQSLIEEICNQTNSLIACLQSYLNDVQDLFRNRKSRLDETLQILQGNHNLVEEIKNSDNIQTICKTADAITSYVKQVDISSTALPRKTALFEEGEINVEMVTFLVGNLTLITLPDTAVLNFNVVKSCNTKTNATIGKKIWIKNNIESVLLKIELQDEPLELQRIKNDKVLDISVTKSGDLLLAIENQPYIKVMKNGSEPITNLYTFNKKIQQVPVSLHAFGDNKIIVGSIDKGENLDTITKKDRKVLLDSMNRQVMTLTESGEQLQVYEFDSEHGEETRKRLFTYPYRITTSIKRGDIIILDRLSKTSGRIISLDTGYTEGISQGKLRWTYDGGQDPNRQHPFDPWDVVVTRHDNVIVCDMRNHTLHILNSEGNIIALQPTKPMGITQPTNMVVDNERLLIIGCSTESKNKANIHLLIFNGC